MTWTTYILECSDSSYYVGHTSDIDARIDAHNSGRGAFYTAKHAPVKLAYSEPFETKIEAVKREKQIKNWSRAKKEALIKQDLKNLKMLSKSRQS